MANLQKLQALTADLTYQPAELANGAVGCSTRRPRRRSPARRSATPTSTCVDLQANVEGSEQAFAALKPGLAKIDPALSSTIATRFAAVDSLLNKYRDASAIGGFVPFTS